jgi:CubicO group peptidase (beta-lactamase class C family)
MRELVSRSTLRILLAVFALPSHAQSKPLQEPNQTSAIDQMFSQEFAKDRAGAVTVGLLKEGQLVWTKSYGVLDQRHKLPQRYPRQTVRGRMNPHT